jgi:hypothetical protein
LEIGMTSTISLNKGKELSTVTGELIS